MGYGAENRGGTKNWPVGSLSATQLSPGQECGGPSQKQKGEERPPGSDFWGLGWKAGFEPHHLTERSAGLGV